MQSTVDYLDADGKPVPNIFADDAIIHYVKAEVVDYNYGFSGILTF